MLLYTLKYLVIDSARTYQVKDIKKKKTCIANKEGKGKEKGREKGRGKGKKKRREKGRNNGPR